MVKFWLKALVTVTATSFRSKGAYGFHASSTRRLARHYTGASKVVTTRSNISRSMSSDEVAAAKAAAEGHKDDGAPTVFDNILSGKWSSDKVYEDDLCLAFRDINPQSPVHLLVIPKNRDGLTQLKNARDNQKDILGHLLYVAKSVGEKECPNGYRIVINDGEHGAQSVYHLHLHVMGGRQMSWPPG